jgi:acyl-CoA dehydrogenase
MADRSYLDWPFFDDAHRELAGRIAEASPGIAAIVGETDDVEVASRALVRALGDDGWLRHAAPYPGALDVRAICLIREHLAWHDGLADFAFAMQGLGTGAVALFGTDTQKARYLPRVASGGAIAAFAMSERDAGSDVAAMKTEVRPDGHGFVIHGEKTWISNAGIADHYVVIVREPASGENRFGAFIVDADSPGLSVTERIEPNAPHVLGTLRFDGCTVPAEARIGAAGGGLRVAYGTLDVFRPTVGAAALGFARRALDEAVTWAKSRIIAGRPLADY